MTEDGRASRFIHSTWGALVALGTAASVGGLAVMWASGLSKLPEEVESLKTAASWQADSIYRISERSIWIVCTTVPPNRPDVLAALKINCLYVADLPSLTAPIQPEGP